MAPPRSVALRWILVLRRRGAVLSGLQRERERFGESGSATTKVFPFILFLIYSHYSPCPFGALMGTLSGAQSRAQSAFPHSASSAFGAASIVSV